jgi:hypothetical protein
MSQFISYRNIKKREMMLKKGKIQAALLDAVHNGSDTAREAMQNSEA